MNSNQYDIYHEKKQHTKPEFAYNTYLCSIPFDFPSVSIHWHNEAEIIAVKKGTGIVEINFKPYILHENEYAFILPGQLHSIKQFENCKMEYENIIFDKSLFLSSSNDIPSNFVNSIFSGEYNIPFIINKDVQYYYSFDEIIKSVDVLCSNKITGYQLAVKGKFFELFYVIISNHIRMDNLSNSKHSDRIKKVLELINEHYAEKITVNDAAEKCCYSKSHFMKFFSQTTGMGFTEYLNSYRLEIAAQMLLSSSDNILDIAERTGFENLSYFNRSFKKKFLVTPSTYRNNQKKN